MTSTARRTSGSSPADMPFTFARRASTPSATWPASASTARPASVRRGRRVALAVEQFDAELRLQIGHAIADDRGRAIEPRPAAAKLPVSTTVRKILSWSKVGTPGSDISIPSNGIAQFILLNGKEQNPYIAVMTGPRQPLRGGPQQGARYDRTSAVQQTRRRKSRLARRQAPFFLRQLSRSARMRWGALARLERRHHRSRSPAFRPIRTATWKSSPMCGRARSPIRTTSATVGRTEAGDVQVMSAGSGIVHSEANLETRRPRFSRSGYCRRAPARPRAGERGRFRKASAPALS